MPVYICSQNPCFDPLSIFFSVFVPPSPLQLIDSRSIELKVFFSFFFISQLPIFQRTIVQSYTYSPVSSFPTTPYSPYSPLSPPFFFSLLSNTNKPSFLPSNLQRKDQLHLTGQCNCNDLTHTLTSIRKVLLSRVGR